MGILRSLRQVPVLLVAALLPTMSATAIAQETIAAIARRATPATVVVLSIGARGDTLGQGSGFIVRSDGVVITARHVLDGASSAIVRLKTGEEFKSVLVLGTDSDADVAVLKVPGFGLPTLTAESATPEVGSTVIAIGAPRGLESTVSNGIVSAVRLSDGKQLIQITAPISPGSSGGPVLNELGRVVAVAVSYFDDGQALNFAVPVRYPMGIVGSAEPMQSVAEAFSATQTNRRGSTSRPAARFPAPAREADATWLVDTYQISGTSMFRSMKSPNRTSSVEWRGLLLLAAENTGLLAMAALDSAGNLEQPSVHFVTSAYATDRGRVLVKTDGNLVWTGYFSEDGGIALVGDSTDSNIRWTDSLVASPHDVALDRPIGLYKLEWRSSWFDANGRESSTKIDWSGMGAVMVNNDSIWIDLTVDNSSGGDTGFASVGRLDRGFFVLQDAGGSTLEGHIDSGVLRAEFVDRRERKTGFKGMIYGTRY